MDVHKEYCPYCGADLQGDPIPKELQRHYGNATHFSRKIGISSLEKDRVVRWQCPDCKGNGSGSNRERETRIGLNRHAVHRKFKIWS